MSKLSKIISAQGQYLLDNYWHAMLCAVVFALLPYTTWLASALIALVTLRKGGREGGLLLLAVVSVYFIFSVTRLSTAIAATSAFILFVPCFLAANILRITASWRAVTAGLFLLVIMLVLFVQMAVPDIIVAQYQVFKSLLSEFKGESNLLQFANDATGSGQIILANYLLGIQMMSMVFTAALSLMFARSIQSQLYYPDGFRQEMHNVRADKMEIIVFGVILFAAYHGKLLAMNILPVLMLYFFLAGLSLASSLFVNRRPFNKFILLFVPLLLMPYIMLPVYLIFGTLDGLFNFRLYLPNKAGK